MKTEDLLNLIKLYKTNTLVPRFGDGSLTQELSDSLELLLLDSQMEPRKESRFDLENNVVFSETYSPELKPLTKDTYKISSIFLASKSLRYHARYLHSFAANNLI